MEERIFTKNILGVSISDEPLDKVLEYINIGLKNRGKKFYVTTPNPEMIVYSHHHPSFKNVLNDSLIALPDGIGLLWAGRLLGQPLKYRITGVDLMEELCKKFAKDAVTVGFLGGRYGVAERVAECLTQKYPELQVVYVGEEWGNGRWVQNENLVSQRTQQKNGSITGEKHIDFLFVAFGFPKQEQWIAHNLQDLPVTAAMGVGGAFDYISGKVGRAPRIVRRIGFEWLWRLIRQPWRLKRQLRLLEFIYLVVRARSVPVLQLSGDKS